MHSLTLSQQHLLSKFLTLLVGLLAQNAPSDARFVCVCVCEFGKSFTSKGSLISPETQSFCCEMLIILLGVVLYYQRTWACFHTRHRTKKKLNHQIYQFPDSGVFLFCGMTWET